MIRTHVSKVQRGILYKYPTPPSSVNKKMDFKVDEKIHVIYEGGEYEGKHLARIVSFPTKSSATVEWISDGEHKGTTTTVRKKYMKKIQRGVKRQRESKASELSVRDELKQLRERVEGIEYFLEGVIDTINKRVEVLEEKESSDFVVELAKYTNENFKKINKLFKKARF